MDQTQTPLPPLRRAQARALIRGVVAPGAYAVAALAIAALPAFDLRWLAAATLALSAVTTVVIAAGLRRAYQRALHRAVDDWRLRLDAAPGATSLDPDACQVLEGELASEDEARAALAAELLGACGSEAASRALTRGLGHPAPAVRQLAIQGLADARHTASADAIAERLAPTEALEVRRAAARALGSLGATRPCVLDGLRRGEGDPDPIVAAECRVARAVFEASGERARAAALEACLSERDPHVLLAAMSALRPEDVASAAVCGALRRLLGADVDVELRRAAARATCRARASALLGDIVRLLEDPRLGGEVAEGLSSWGSEALDPLSRTLSEAPPTSARRVASALTLAPGVSGQTLFLRLLSHADSAVRETASRALAYVVHDGRRAPLAASIVEPLIDRELALAYRLYSVLAGLARDDGTPDWEIDPPLQFLAGEIALRIDAGRRRVLRLLGLIGNREVVQAVEFGLRRGAARDAQIAELLELSLPPALAERVVPLFDRLTLRDRVEIAQRLGYFAAEAAKDPLATIVASGDPHVRGAALIGYEAKLKARYPELYEKESPLIPLFQRMSFLRTVPLFAELSGEDLRSVAEIVEQVELPAKAAIFRKGDPGEDLYVVLRGQITVGDGRVELARLGPREFFGELAVLDREPRSADAVCVEDAELLRLKGADLGELMARRPQIQEQILLVLVRRLRKMTERVSE